MAKWSEKSGKGKGPGKLNKELIADAVKLIQTGLNDRDTCAALGIDPSTWYKWLQEPRSELQEELFTAVSKAKAERKAFHLNNIVKAARDGTWQASAWYLERAYPQEYGKCQRLPESDQRAVDAVKALMEKITVAAAGADDGA